MTARGSLSFASLLTAATGWMRLEYVSGSLSSEIRRYAVRDPSGLVGAVYSFTGVGSTTSVYTADHRPFGEVRASSGTTEPGLSMRGQVAIVGSDARVWSGSQIVTLRARLSLGGSRAYDPRVGAHLDATPAVWGGDGLRHPYAVQPPGLWFVPHPIGGDLVPLSVRWSPGSRSVEIYCHGLLALEAYLLGIGCDGPARGFPTEAGRSARPGRDSVCFRTDPEPLRCGGCPTGKLCCQLLLRGTSYCIEDSSDPAQLWECLERCREGCRSFDRPGDESSAAFCIQRCEMGRNLLMDGWLCVGRDVLPGR